MSFCYCIGTFQWYQQFIYRLTTDVQEFKSSFKLCISQGLRSVTQIIGCVMSLFMMSPQMTGVVSICLPAMIATGSVMGVVLRRWSREAQEQVWYRWMFDGENNFCLQVEKATACADEAIANIRTVRAFAMEERELE